MTYLLYSHLLSVLMLSRDVRKRFTIKQRQNEFSLEQKSQTTWSHLFSEICIGYPMQPFTEHFFSFFLFFLQQLSN